MSCGAKSGRGWSIIACHEGEILSKGYELPTRNCSFQSFQYLSQSLRGVSEASTSPIEPCKPHVMRDTLPIMKGMPTFRTNVGPLFLKRSLIMCLDSGS